MQALIGSLLLQRFRIDTLLRQGEVGNDYRGVDIKRSMPVLIKVLHAPLPPDPALLSFQQGQQTLQSLAHANIIPFYGLYQDQQVAFMVERAVQGTSLREEQLDRRGQAYELDEALIILKALCQALAYAQSFGIVHCNVTPANIWLESGGNILLGGFGLARSIDTLMTATGEAGPPLYTAPELLRRQAVAPSADIYNLGLILFELTTGQHPFAGPMRITIDPVDALRLANAQINQTPPHPRTLNPKIPDGMAQAILTALAKAPRDRYQSTQEMFEIACAMLNRIPEAVPDRFTPPGEYAPTVMGRAPQAPATPAPPPHTPVTSVQTVVEGRTPLPPSAQTMITPPPQGRAGEQTVVSGAPLFPGAGPTMVNPPVPGGLPPAPAQRGPAPQPATQVWRADERQNAGGGYAAPPAGNEFAGLNVGPGREEPARRSRLPIILIVLLMLLCLAGTAAGVYLLAGGLLPTALPSETAVPTATLPPTLLPTLPPTESLPEAATAVPVLPPTAAPTQPPLILPSATFTLPPTLPPSPTLVPTATPVPASATPVPTNFTVTIRNNLGFAVFAFRDGVLMGTDPIPSNMYIFYRHIPTGWHTFTVCQTATRSNCQPEQTIMVDQDLTVKFPGN